MKRFGSFNVNSNKKQKIEDNLDDLWGDDLDVKDVDDCFMLASQILEQDEIMCTQINNVSILPSYHSFKRASNNAFTSTQNNPELNENESPPTTSKSQINGFKRRSSFDAPKEEVDMKIKKLEKGYEIKMGEVSILRSKLDAIQKNKEAELHKQQKDWSDKLIVVNKELTGVKSELEFKNLEIANLKQQVAEQIRWNSLNSTVNSIQAVSFTQPKMLERPVTKKKTKNVSTNKKNFKIHPTTCEKYPLKDKIPKSIFSLPSEEKYMIDIEHKHSSRNTVPYLQNQMSQELTEKLIRLQPKVTLTEGNRPLSINMIYADICMLMNCNERELEFNQNLNYINNVLCVSEQLTQNLYSFLKELEQNVHQPSSGNINLLCLENQYKHSNFDRSPFDAKKWSENELGISARQTIALISELLPFNNYLQGYLLENKPLSANISQEYIALPAIAPKLNREYANTFDYLHLILNVIVFIRKLRKSANFLGFLGAVVMLLNKITMCFNVCLMSDKNLIYNIMREVILCEPDLYLLLQLSEFLKNASLQKLFINRLCEMPHKTNNEPQIILKDKVLYYSEDTCVLQIFCVLLEEVSKKRNSEIVDLYLNMTKFTLNSFRHNSPWLFYQEDKHCDCLYKVVKLYIDILYQTLKMFRSNKSNYCCPASVKYFEILKSGISILYILNFKVYDMIMKYVTTCSQYKVIIKSLLNLKEELKLSDNEVELLESLNMPEEMCQTLEKLVLDKVSPWNKCSLFD